MSVVVIEQKVGELMRTDQAARGQEPPTQVRSQARRSFKEVFLILSHKGPVGECIVCIAYHLWNIFSVGEAP